MISDAGCSSKESKLCLWESDTAKYVEIPAQASECSETECTKLKANEDKLIAYFHRVTSPRFDKKPNRFFCMAPLNLIKLNFICGCFFRLAPLSGGSLFTFIPFKVEVGVFVPIEGGKPEKMEKNPGNSDENSGQVTYR